MDSIRTFLMMFFLLSSTNAGLIIDDFVQTSNPEVANFSASMFKNPDGLSVMNMTIDFAYEVSKIMIAFKFSIPKDANDKNYERTLISSNVNACRMISGIMGDFLTKMIMADLKKYADFELKCPFAKGRLCLYNFTLATEGYLPTFLLGTNIKYLITARLIGKTPKSKGLVHLFTVKVYGEITK